MSEETTLPLEGIRVVEFSHMAMGPSAGLLLGDLGADVVKVEPPGGDKTRALPGSGSGLFPAFNRNKRSLQVDLKSDRGRELVGRLVDSADVVTENFRPGALGKLGLDYETLSRRRPQLVYCSLKGFLPGPYERRTALDEVVQMMGGLAYMTGPPGRPLRAGASVNDIMGGMFAAIGIMAALRQRERTGRGQLVRSSLFENSAFLMSPHMAQVAIYGQDVAPMPAREATWPVYDIFLAGDGRQIFLGAVSGTQWLALCEGFGLAHLRDDPELNTNEKRVARRDHIHRELQRALDALSYPEIVAICERQGLPFAPVATPADLLEDPHLAEPGASLDVTLRTGARMRMPALPLELDGRRLGLQRDIPQPGEHTYEIAMELGYSPQEAAEFADAAPSAQASTNP